MMYDFCIIGAGVIGTHIARELSKYDVKTCILEKADDVSEGASKANSGIIHGGYAAKFGTLKGRLNVIGNQLFQQLDDELQLGPNSEEVADRKNEKLHENRNFNPYREPVIHPRNLPAAELKRCIAINSSPEKIICRCEQVTEGEIVDAITRNIPVTTVYAVKKRIRAGMGRCQGNFCKPRVQEII